MTTLSLLKSDTKETDNKVGDLRKVFTEQSKRGYENRCRIVLKWLCYQSGLRMLTFDRSLYSLSEREKLFFNQAANLYNLAQSDKLSALCSSLECKEDVNFVCLSLYFQANQAILRHDLEQAKHCIAKGLLRAKESNKYELLTMMLSSPLARVYRMEGQREELQNFLTECFMMLELKGKVVSGRFLGWLFYSQAQERLMRGNALDLSNASCLSEYIRYSNTAVAFLEYALDVFNEDETEDKLFGQAYCLCRLVICLLGCGEDGSTKDLVDTPYPSEFRSARKYLDQLDKSPTRHCVVIQIIHEMAKSDYFYRTRNFQGALESAVKAAELSEWYGCSEFTEITRKRKELYMMKSEKWH